jgi:hypothetical protein
LERDGACYISASFTSCGVLLVAPTAANNVGVGQAFTTSVCIGDKQKCYPPASSFDCDFAQASPLRPDEAAANLYCASKRNGSAVLNVTRLRQLAGGKCGYIVDSVTCTN